jgi:SAM-dependent methyltransferase
MGVSFKTQRSLRSGDPCPGVREDVKRLHSGPMPPDDPSALSLAYYDSESIRGHTFETAPPGERERMELVMERLPRGRPILDAGCGEGRLTNELARRGFDVTGADISPRALRAVEATTVEASAHDLPFADRAFDTVVACALLEHLPAGVFEQSLSEIARVAARRIIVTGPNDEDLVMQQTRCRGCETTFSAARHTRALRPDAIAFPEFRLAESLLTGQRIRYRSRTVQRLAVMCGHVSQQESVCPNCGYRVEVVRPRVAVRLAFGGTQRLLGFTRPPCPSQLLIVFDRLLR